MGTDKNIKLHIVTDIKITELSCIGFLWDIIMISMVIADVIMFSR